MKRFALTFLFLFLATPHLAISQAKIEASQMPYAGAPCTADGGVKPSAQQVAVFNRFNAEFRSALRRNDAAAMSFLIHFPLRVNTNKGAMLIPDAPSLAGHFAEIFPPAIRDQVLSTGADDYICRYDEGLGYKAGVIWASTDDHKFALDVVNSPDLHSNSQTPALAYACETTTHRITIDELPNESFHFRSWNKPKSLAEVPDLDIPTGTMHFEGTGVCSVPIYTFSKGNAVYTVDGDLGCTDGSEPRKAIGHLTVTIADKKVTDAWCF